MGWTSYHATHYKNGKVDRKAEIDAMWNDGSGKYEVLKSAIKGRVYYAAIRTEEKVFAAIYLTSTNSKDFFNFSYKDMTETMYPFYFDCPVEILNLLTETNNEYALEWRKKCRENHARKKAEKNNPNSLKNLPVGTRIMFTGKNGTNVDGTREEFTLTKTSDNNGKVFWYGYGCKWSEKIILEISKGTYHVKG